jgi:asparagine synthase (glutamine-hydrolysing)
MIAQLRHRGPDGTGVWSEGHVGLAHCRLSIIDLRAIAGQPMCNEDGTVWVTFNGEIYNFKELRKELEGRGHTFRTDSDTEVLVHAYEEYGRECLHRLRGMFAFGIWDGRSRTLLLARDRLGKKPLVYYFDHSRFIFASEAKAILAEGSVPIEPDPIAIDQYLVLGYVPAPRTAFKGICKLPPGHWLEVREGRVLADRYWKLHYSPKRVISLQEATAEFRWRFAEAVRLRLVSDVPIGAFLSGGIDSSAVVAAMAKAINRPVRTFSVGFEDATFDERPFARLVAHRFQTDHTELVVNAPVADILPNIAWFYDEPFGDSSSVPSYAIAQLTRQHVRVVLNGDGGDENFAGYDRYVPNRLARYGDFLPLAFRHNIADVIRRLPLSWRRFSPMNKLSRIAEMMAQMPERRFARWSEHFQPHERQALYTDDFSTTLEGHDPERLFADRFQQSDAEDWTDASLDVDIGLYLPDDLLVKMDRATMAHSLEARSPFLDHELMEFVASLPPRMKLFGWEKKRLLRNALRGSIPNSILDRPKRGFEVPLAKWFRHELRELSEEILLSSRANQRGYFRSDRVAQMIRNHQIGVEDWSVQLWDLLMLEQWHRTFIDPDTRHVLPS